MLPLLWLGGFAGGAGLALAAKEPLARASFPAETRYFVVVGLFAASAIAPASLVLYLLYPDWALMYFADPAHLPLWLVLPFVLALGLLTPVSGFFAVQRLLAGRHRHRPMLYGLAVVSLSVLVFGWHRLSVLAYYDAFHLGGDAISLFASEALLPLLLVLPALVAGYVLARRGIQRHIKELATVDESMLPRAREG